MEAHASGSVPNRTPAVPATLERFPLGSGRFLALERFGAPAHPALVYTHGFGQNRQAWRNTAQRLAAAGWHGLAIDGRGHGDSDWHPDYRLEDFQDDLTRIARGFERKPILLGASMGGLLGLLAEAEQPGGCFAALVLVDVTPRWERQGVERILDFMRAHPEGFLSLEAAQQAIERYLPHRQRKDPERLASQLRRGSDGRYRWHWDPKLLDAVGRDAERYIPRLLAAAARIRIPVLLLSGGRSDVVSERTIEEFKRLVPHAEHQVIEDATHLVVGDRNDAFAQAIERYLAGLRPAIEREIRHG